MSLMALNKLIVLFVATVIVAGALVFKYGPDQQSAVKSVTATSGRNPTDTRGSVPARRDGNATGEGSIAPDHTALWERQKEVISALFRTLPDGLTEKQLEEIALGIVVNAREQGIQPHQLLNYVMETYQQDHPLFAMLMADKIAVSSGESAGAIRSIISAAARSDLKLAISLTLHFANGPKFEGATAALLPDQKRDDVDLLPAFAGIRSGYTDPEDLKVVDLNLFGWLQSRGKDLDSTTLANIAGKPGTYGAEPADQAMILLWAQNGRSVESALELISMVPEGVPSRFIGQVVKELVSSQTPVERIAEIGNSFTDRKARELTAYALVNSDRYFTSHTDAISKYVAKECDLGFQTGTFAYELMDQPEEAWKSALLNFDEPSQEKIVSKMASMSIQWKKLDQAEQIIAHMTESPEKTRLLADLKHLKDQ
jgi:hypothetical protein